MQYRKDIDGLRAVAVLSVVFFHANENLLRGGFVGVDIFFVISGFLICQIIMKELQNGDFSILRFYERRARRILPALTAVIIFALFAGVLIYLPSDLEALGEAAVASSLFLSNFYFMKEVHYFAAPLESYSLLHLWSLAVEEQFYIVTPIVMILVYRFRPNRVVYGLIFLTILSLIVSVLLAAYYPKGAFYMLPSRFWEMGIGAVLGLGSGQYPTGRSVQFASVTGGFLILGSVLLIGEGPPFPGLLAVPPVIGAALYIWAGPAGVCNRLLSYRPFVWIGLISYSLYLWHWPLLSYAKYVNVVDLGWPLTSLAIIVSFIAAFVSYRFIERPFRRRSDRSTVRRVLLVSAATVMLISLAGAVLTVGRGVPDRWQANSLAVLRMTDKVDVAIRNGCRDIVIAALPNGRTCVVGEWDGPYDFIVWGDSHAGAMRAGFAQLAFDTDTTGLVIYKNACSSLLGRRNRSMPFWLNCSDHNLDVLEFLETQETTNVVLVSRWLTAGHNIQFHTGDDVSFVEKVLKLTESGSFEASIQRTVSALVERNKVVFWLKTVPGQNWHVPSTLAKSLEWGRPVPPLLTRAAYEAEHQVIDEMFDKVGNAVAIPTVDIFCGTISCDAQREGVALYFDDDHVSQYGATLVASAIKQVLEQR